MALRQGAQHQAAWALSRCSLFKLAVLAPLAKISWLHLKQFFWALPKITLERVLMNLDLGRGVGRKRNHSQWKKPTGKGMHTGNCQVWGWGTVERSPASEFKWEWWILGSRFSACCSNCDICCYAFFERKEHKYHLKNVHVAFVMYELHSGLKLAMKWE